MNSRGTYSGKGVLRVALLSLTLAAAPTFAQTPPPAQPAPKPPAPTTPAPAQTAPAPVQPAPKPFPDGVKIAFVDIQRIASESGEGKASTARINAYQQKKAAELAEKNKLMQADQQKLQSGGSVMSDTARAELEKKIERQQVDIQRATQDAQQELQEMQRDLQVEFQRKLQPIIQQVAQEKGLYMLFSVADSGIAWADLSLDVTNDVIKRFDAAPPAAPATKPVPKPPGQ
jgi:outer membrane protein